MKKSISLFSLITFIFIGSCKTPFDISIDDYYDVIPVIEGDIIIGDVSRIFVSWAVNLADGMNSIYYSSDADVWAEDEGGTRYPTSLSYDNGRPYYLLSMVDASIDKKYRLCVDVDGYFLRSDFMEVLITPPIDEISFKIPENKSYVDFNVSSKGDSDQSKYYLWTFNETWEFSADLLATHEYNPERDLISELIDNHKFYCWTSAVSTDILIASTENLTENRVSEREINRIYNTDKRVEIMYYIEVFQQSITLEKYNYLVNLKKNSDEIGGIFGPLPSETSGNIICTNMTDLSVMGFISCSTISKKDRYVAANELRIYYRPIFYECELDPDFDYKTYYEVWFAGWDIFTSAQASPPVWRKKECLDCRYYGTKEKPQGWPTDHL